MQLREIGFAVAMLAWLVVGTAGSPASAQTETRVALIIANAAYAHSGRLKNPVSDGRLLRATLEQLGFAVEVVEDATARDMKRAMLEFGRKLRAGDTVGLFYYAGHGVQVKGENYLIPVEANITDEAEVAIEGVNVNEFLSTMESAKSRIKIVILDACRNNPFPGSSRSVARGLAPVRAPTGTLIAYATSPGEVALDGDGDNSPFAAAIATAMRRDPSKPIEIVFREARTIVIEATGGQQTPWDLSSITGDFILKGGAASAATSGAPLEPVAPADPVPTTAQPPSGGAEEISEKEAYALALELGTVEAWDAFLGRYPSGFRSEIARATRDRLLAERQAAEQPPDTGSQQGAVGSAPRSSDTDLSTWSCDELWYARNEIFARKGQCFKTERAISVFGKACFPPYGKLASAEKRKVDAIVAQERYLGCN